jgi:ABC-type sulfate/molybdate transport systems ATPase subunit
MADLKVRAKVVHGATASLDVDLTLATGITCVVGPSGAGKSTLLAVIAGLVEPREGRIALGDEVWFDAATGVATPVHLRRVAYVFQRLALFPHLDGVGNVSYGIDRSLPRAERRDRARALLERVGASALAHRRPPTYSGGEAQRVAIARALAMSPRVILLDEPFSALDRDLKVQLAALVRDLVDDLDVPLVYVTHSHGEARALADRAVRLERGQVVAQGTPSDILGRPRDGGGDDDVSPPHFDGTPMPELIRRR